jgi:hypothetical protein
VAPAAPRSGVQEVKVDKVLIENVFLYRGVS